MSSDLKQVVGSIFVFVGQRLGFTGWGVFFYAAGAALLASGGRQAAKKADAEARMRARAEAASRSIKANVRGSSETHFVVFGKVRVGGIICALGVDTTDRSKLHLGIAHSITHPGGCEGVGSLWVDDEKISTAESPSLISGDGLSADAAVTLAKYVYGGTNMITFRHYRGTSTQTADATITGVGVVGGGSTAYRRGVCWTRITLDKPSETVEGSEAFNLAFPRGIPNFSFELSGCRCYDPRLDSTNGGSGSHRYTDATTWAFSQNPAVIAATYMIMETSDGGMGYNPATRVDWDSVAAAANICDETTDDGQSPTVSFTRYQCNIGLDTSNSRQDNLQKILDTMHGVRVKVGAKFKLYAGAYRTPTFDFDDTFLRGAVRISTRSSLEQLYNAVRVVHDDAAQNYRTVEAPAFTSAAYEAQDGGERLWKEVSLPGVTNTHQAQYIGQILGAQSRKQKIIEAPCNLKALDIEAWETGTVTLDELGIAGAVYRVISWEWESEGPVLILREESSDVYDTDALDTSDATARTEAENETPVTPTNLSATASNAGIWLRWDRAPGNSSYVDVYRQSGSGSPQTWALLASGVLGTGYLDEPTDALTYQYRVQRRSSRGALSAFSSSVSASTGSVRVAASGARLGDQRNAVAVLSGSRTPAIASANPLTATDAGATARIDIAAFNYQFGFGQVSYNSGSVTGLAFSTLYYVYLTDPTFAGGAVTYGATTTAQNVTADSGRIHIGNITTPADGGGSSGGGGGQIEP